MIIATIFFWVCLISIVHSYLIYPIILKFASVHKRGNTTIYAEDSPDLPTISIVMAAYNEERVLEEKIKSIFDATYPLSKVSVYIGSDNSSDSTNEIATRYAIRYPNLFLTEFKSRQGKANIINKLSQEAQGEILILTDANVFFTPTLFYQLVKHFRNSNVGIVGANIINTNLQKSGISIQEKTYLTNENILKYREGVLWGAMIGAFGGCYAIRKTIYTPVPKNFFMDDFFITMAVLQQKYLTLNELDALCYEDVSNAIDEEYRRKVRISIGNFQNLTYFRKLLWPPFSSTAFAFMSHKVLRWLTPFMLIIALFSNILLLPGKFYIFTLVIQSVLLTLPIIDYLFKKIGLHIVPLRFVTHFYSMNIALLHGFFKYYKGVKSNVWQPTKRFQQ